MDLEYYDNLYDEENHVLIKHQHDRIRYTGYQCNICNVVCNQMNMIKCKLCLETSNLWISSDHDVFRPACNYCAKKYDLCTQKRSSKFCKKYAIKLNCSSKWCANSHKLKNQRIYIIKAKKGTLKWKWRPGFDGYKLGEQYVNFIQSATISNSYNIFPRKIGDDWYRIFCDDCLKSCYHSFSNNLKFIGKQLLNSMKNDINDKDKSDEYIREQRTILFDSTKRAIKSKFCEDITNIIFEMCIGYNIGEYLMSCTQCSSISCNIEPEIWVFQGIGSKLCFYSVTHENIYVRTSYYILNNDYIEKLLLVKTKTNNNIINVLNKYGIRLIEGKYYRIFCYQHRYLVSSCSHNQCKNRHRLFNLKIPSSYCLNHMRCIVCHNYIIIDHDKYNQCKYCHKLYHLRKCGDINKCCGQCLVQYIGIIKYYHRKNKNGIIQIRGRLNEFSICCSLPLINKLIDHNKPTKAQQPLVNALENMFERFASNDDNTMSIDDMRKYILYCLNKQRCSRYSTSTSRIEGIFRKFGKSETKLSTKGFIDFYAEAILNRPQHVISDLNVFGFKEDVLFKVNGKRINALFGDYKYKRRDKHRFVNFVMTMNDDGTEYAINVKQI